MNKFLQKAWEIEDRSKGFTVSRGTKPVYHRQPVNTHLLADVATIVGLALLVGMIFGYALSR